MGSDMSEGIFTVRCEIQKFENWETNQQKICLTGVERGRTEIGGLGEWDVGVGDGHRQMHRLHDVLQFFETSLKHRIVKK